jgi:hypothetical protein
MKKFLPPGEEALYASLDNLYFAQYTLVDLLEKTTSLSSDIARQIKPIRLFADYLWYGYSPFFREDKTGYPERLSQVVNLVIESDIPAVFQVDYNATLNRKKLLGFLTEMMPFKPNMQKLSRQPANLEVQGPSPAEGPLYFPGSSR